MATNVQVSANGSDDDPLKYNEAFPPLPGAFGASSGARGPALRSTKQVVTSMMHIPFEERKYKDPNAAQQEAQTRVCQQIMQDSGVKLELTATRNGQLTVVLTGKPDAVAKARRQVANDLQTRASNQLNIPREHYGFILGRNRQRLNGLQVQTNTEIFVPGPNDANGMIRVSGTREGVIAACAELRKWSEERSKLAEERLQVDRSLHAFIAGPGGEFVKQYEGNHNVRIHMPPPKRATNDAAPAAGNAPQNARGASHHSENEIVISGDREAVAAVKAAVMKIVNEKQGKIQAIPVNISKAQHRYVIGRNGANLADIQRETGVVVEVPPAESATETITLRGEQSQLGRAVTLVYEKANSVVRVVVPAATWLHRHVIGRDGAKLNELLTAAGTTRDRVRVEFETDGEVDTKTPGLAAAQGPRIILEGAPAECEAVRGRVDAYLSELRRTVTCRELRVEARFVKHLIGKKGATINKIKNDTGCQIVIPSEHEQEGNAVIRIEGEPSAVEKARAELEEIHKRIQNETQKDVEIEQKLHKQIIGAKGERIREIRNEFTDVQITFPEPGRRSDIVQLRGPRNDVDRCAKQLLKCAQELAERSYESTMHVNREYVRYVVGKGGATLNKLREEHDVRINIPGDQPAGISTPSTGNNEGEIATIEFIGRKKNVEAAKKAIENLVKEVAKIRELRIDVPPAVLNALLQNPRFIKQLRDECQPVTVRLPDAPAAKTASKTPTQAESFITLRGLDKEVDVAKQKASKLLDEIRENSFVDSIVVRPEFHRFLVGRNHANVKRYREESNVRVVVPIANRATATSEEDGVVAPATADGDDRSRITLIGKQADVAHVKQDLERVVRELENTIETTVEIDAKWHKRFLQRSGVLVRQISEELGNVVISFPKHVSPKHAAKKDEQEKPAEEDASGQQSNTVRIKGPRDCVNEAVKRLQEQVNDWQNEVTSECSIPRRYHAAMLANRGTYVQQIAERHSVVIRFPERRTSPKQPAQGGKPAESAAAEHTEADAEHEAAPDAVETHDEEAVTTVTAAGTQDSAEEEGGAADIITVIGKRENVDLASEELRKLVPITDYFELTNDCVTQCRNLSVIEMRRMMQEFGVRLTVLEEPERGDQTKRVEIYGIPTRIEDTKRELTKRVEQYDAWRREQAARNARTVLHVAEKWHSNLIGRKGERIQSLQKRHNVRIILGNRGPANRARADAAPNANAAEKRDANDEHTEQQTTTEVSATTEQTANTEHAEQSEDTEVQQKTEHANATEESEESEEAAHGADEIVIVGYVERAAECVQEIEKLVAEWELQVTESVDIDARVHPRLIGSRGSRLKELMDRFNVRVTIGRDTTYPDRVIVSGRREKVTECIEEMLSIADEYMQDFEYVSRSKTRTLADHFSGPAAPEQQQQQQQQQQPAQPKSHSGKKGIKIVGGPWDTAAKAGAGSGKQYEEDFPAMGHTNGTTSGPTTPEAHAASNGVPVWTGAKR